MTEAEWLAGTTCTNILVLDDPFSWERHGRKARLYACACCRRLADFLPDAWCHDAIDLAERNVDGCVTRAEWYAVALVRLRPPDEARERHRSVARDAVEWLVTLVGHAVAANTAASRAAEAMGHRAVGADKGRADGAEVRRLAESREREYQCRLLHDIVGNPFRPIALNPALLTWHHDTIPALAQAVYDDRALPSGHLDAHRLAVFADALEDAGCTDRDVPGHCRGEGEHVRGCWVVDLLLGKE